MADTSKTLAIKQAAREAERPFRSHVLDDMGCPAFSLAEMAITLAVEPTGH